jgi:hypothetical protein
MAGKKDGKNKHAQAMAALGASKGGLARAQAMSPEERRSVAKKAAMARWGTDLPKETHSGVLAVGGIPCAVLDNEKRVLTVAGINAAFGSRKKGANQGSPQELRGFPPFLANARLASFISAELFDTLRSPLVYRTRGGNNAYAYDADLLALICEAIMEAERANSLLPGQRRLADAARTLYKGLVRVGIVALIDEATGHQADRGRDALAKILEKFIAKELGKWVRTFPPDFYKEIFRLNAWPYTPDSVKRPGVIAHYTKDVVYARLAPGVLDELKRVTPKNDAGKPRAKLFQSLTEDLGHPRLREHLYAVVALMKISKDWAGFTRHLDSVFPRFGDTLSMYPDVDSPSFLPPTD